MTRFIWHNKRKICGMAICALAVTCGVGTARAATCDAGYWLNNGECAPCSEKYYCPGDDTRHACPAPNTTEQIITLVSPHTLLTNPDYSKMTVAVSTNWFGGLSGSTNIERCGIVIHNIDGDEARLGEIGFLYSESVGDYAGGYVARLYTAAYAGYYLKQKWPNGSGRYVAFAPCTNEIPANSHYSGPGTPDVGDCPWECDAGYGHTSDDRCLPLCRIGDTAMNGINIYAEKHTKYAMAVPRAGATCWINATRDNGGKLQMVN